MRQSKTIYINFRGGIVSPGYLKDILDIASESLVSHASFGLRQQLIMDVPVKKLKDFEIKCREKNIPFYDERKAMPNLVSSYCTSNIFSGESWLSEGVYKDVFDLFNYQPALMINICDSKQSLIPFFSGHLNWISSAQAHFWRLAIRFPGTRKIFYWPELVYTNDLSKVSAAIEELIPANEAPFKGSELTRGNLLFHSVRERISYNFKPVVDKLLLPVFHLPYYEGFNKDGETSWLGIYRRDELFAIDFLKEICIICLETKIGQFYTTSWKSIIIKGIHETERKIWDHVLGTYRINVRHAANELNWQIEDNNEDGLILKRHVIRHFDIEDVRTYGLSFAIKTRISPGIFGSVIISKQYRKNSTRLKSMDRFEIFHTRDFNPNSTDLVSFRKDVEKDQLGTYLVSLCKFFYEQDLNKSQGFVNNNIVTAEQASEPTLRKNVYQCRHCLSVYDEETGEPENNIIPGTTFKNLPGSYTCPLCEADKKDFTLVAIESLAAHLG